MYSGHEAKSLLDREGCLFMDSNGRKPNTILRHQRQLRSWTLQDVADKLYDLCKKEDPHCGINADIVGRWERGTTKPSSYYQGKLSMLYNMAPNELGLIEQTEQQEPNATATPAPSHQTPSILLL